MGSTVSWFVILLVIFEHRSFCRAQNTGESDLMTIQVCETHGRDISCTNDELINIIYANYGRTSDVSQCPDDNSKRVTNCSLDSSLETVRNRCQGQNSCFIFATDLVFNPDPCPDVKKYLEVNYTCGVQDTLSCSSTNICNKTTEVCVDMNGVIFCECAENYQKGNDGNCQAATCQNSPNYCNAITERCQNHSTGIECVCADGYVKDSNDECTATTCQNSPSFCNPITERCQNDTTGIKCVCADGYVRNSSNECTEITCQNSGGKCNEITQRCENLYPGIQCVCAEGFVRDNNNECTEVTCKNSPSFCNPITERCQNDTTGIKCVCADGYVRNSSNECTAIKCQNSGGRCNDTTQRCEDLSPGIQCVCAEGFVSDNNSECTVTACLSLPKYCNTTTERCQDRGTGIECVCMEGYFRDTNMECVEMKGDDSTTDTPEHENFCSADVISIGGIALSFPSAKTGEEVNSTEICSEQLTKNQRKPLATRMCNKVWQEPKLQNCFDVKTAQEQLNILLQLNLTDVNIVEISKSLALLTYQSGNTSALILDLVVESLDRIVTYSSASFEVTDAVVGIVSSVMQINETVLNETESVASVIPLMEEQLTNVHRNAQNYSQVLPNLGISAVQVQKTVFEGDFTFIDHVTNIEENTENEDSVQETSITLPYSVLEAVDKVYPNTTTIPISFVTYQDARLFRKNENQASRDMNVTEEYIGSYVISSTVELPNVTIRDLPQNSSVIIRFSDLMLNRRGNDAATEVLCVFWEYTSESGEGEWSQAGCRKLSSGFDDVTCSCDHLTSFAVLVRTYDEEETSLHLALQLISTIGCIISIIGLFLSLMCMIIIRKVRVKQQTHVHFNLCLALLGLYLSFLFGIDQADQPDTCRRMTSVIYFFCLSSMAWMSVEAFYIYKLIWKCSRNHIKHLIPVGILFAWGMPGIAAVVIYFLDNTHDYKAEPDYCFLHPGHVLLYGFLLELLILFLYNSIVFVLVTYRISCRKIQMWNKEDRRQELIIRLKSTFLFWLLLGISWIFGFLATFEQPASIVFQIIFCVLLSLQGFFMFYMLIVQNPEMKKSLSSVSSLRSQSVSRSSTEHYTKKQSRQENALSLDQINDKNPYV